MNACVDEFTFSEMTSFCKELDFHPIHKYLSGLSRSPLDSRRPRVPVCLLVGQIGCSLACQLDRFRAVLHSEAAFTSFREDGLA